MKFIAAAFGGRRGAGTCGDVRSNFSAQFTCRCNKHKEAIFFPVALGGRGIAGRITAAICRPAGVNNHPNEPRRERDTGLKPNASEQRR